jgi:hypothetical protein
MSRQNGTPTWVYLAVGCGGVIVLGGIALGLFGYLGYRWTAQLESDLTDPVARATKTQEILGYERLPAGYNPAGAISVPFLMDVAILSDRTPDEQGKIEGFDRRGFVFVRMRDIGDNRRELGDFFEGKIDDPEVLRNLNLRIDSEEILERGELQLDDARLVYVVNRGELEGNGSRLEGLTSVSLVECPGDDKLRLAVWFGPDPSDGGAIDSADVSGSPADEQAVRDFLGHFSLCSAG